MIAGIHSQIFISGTPLTMATPLPLTLVSGKTYKMADNSKSIWRSPEIRPTFAYMASQNFKFEDLPYEAWSDLVPYFRVYDNGTANANRVDPINILDIDFKAGRMTFKSSYAPTGTIYVQTDYIPLSNVLCGKTFSLKCTTELSDSTTFYSNETDDFRRKTEILSEATVNITNYFNESINFVDKLLNSEFVYVKIYLDKRNTSKFFVIKGAVETEDYNIDIEDVVSEEVTISSIEKVSVIR